MRTVEEIDSEIKKLLGIPEEEKINSLISYKNGRYFLIETYSPSKYKRTRKSGEKKYHVRKEVKEQILFLWREREKVLKKEKELERKLKEIISEYSNPDFVREVLEKVLQERLKREAKDFAYEKFKTKALELFEEFKPYLLKLKKENLKRISLLQVLYLLANVKEMFKEKGEEEIQKAIERAIKTILFRDKNQKLQNPFGVLKSDMFTPSKTEYDFLLSPFLEAELTPILEKLLEAEIEKIETQEAMAEISDFIATLSQKAKKRILKVFPSFSEFSKALYGSWKKSKEDLKEFLTEWKSYLEMEVSKAEERQIIEFLKSLNRT